MIGLFGPFTGTSAGLMQAAAPETAGWPTATLPEDSIAGLFSDSEAARAVGLRYLAYFPAEADREWLWRMLSANLKYHPSADPDSLGGALGNQCRQEFMAGSTVLVDGWILARSEARVCALLALL
jgi:hypothetical protein